MEKSTSFHTIARILLRELRDEAGVQQSAISQRLGRASTSSWSKVESGDTPLTLEHLLTACHILKVWPSNFFVTVQNYATLLSQNGWFVADYGSPLNKDEDLLSIEANSFYTHPNKLQPAAWSLRASVLQSPWPYQNIYAPIDVFKWVLDPQWKQQVLGAGTMASIPILSSF